jgi:hypothetical protein
MVNLAHVGIVGAGQMGSGIAHVCAAAGLAVSLVDVSGAALDRGLAAVERRPGTPSKRGTLTADDMAAVMSRIRTGTDHGCLKVCRKGTRAMFTALLLTQENRQTVATSEHMESAQLPPGDVTVGIEYSSLDFKDAMAVTGLAEHVRPDLLDRMTAEVALSDIVAKSVDLLEGRLRGRTVVDVNR